MADANAFDSLVSGISAQERQLLLDKMRDIVPSTSDSFTPIEQVPSEPEIPLAELLKKEPLSLRLILWLKSIFTSTSPEQLFNEVKVAGISRSLAKNYPGLIDARRGLLLPLFYDRICELKATADFFRPYIVSMEQDEGSFFVFLGSVVMPTVAQEMNESADPFTNPISAEVRLELRVELLRCMEDVFANIPPDLRRDMYDAVKSVEWLRRFVRLPFARLISLFSEVTTEIHTCPFSQIEGELAAMARCLCNGFRLSDGVMESLYLFSVRNSRHVSDDIDEEGGESIKFMQGAREHIAILKLFMDSVPMLSVCSVAYSNCHWRPEEFTGGEDWFVKFKASWKRIFEQKWESWTVACKREMLRQSLHGHFGLNSFPRLPNRPWSAIKGGGVRFRYELTGGFLTWYFLEKFPAYEIAIKSLMLEGTFKKKENQTALTDAFNAFVQLSVAMNGLNDRLKPSGDVGVFLARIGMDDQPRTLQEQAQIEQMMRSVTGDLQSILHRFGESDRALEQLLAGVLGVRREKGFDTVTNLSQIMGRENHRFQKTLGEARQSLESALNLVRELELVDAPEGLDVENL